MNSFTQLFQSFKKWALLNGFWQKRTTFYRDLAQALQDKELPLDFIRGELTVATSPATSDKNRATGLMYLQNILTSADISLYQALVATMPSSDSLALSTLQHAKDVPLALRQLAENVDQQTEMTKMIRQALFSPMLLLPVAYVFAYVLSTVSIPEFAKAAPDEVWTPFNSFVKNSAEFFANYSTWLALLIVAGLVWVFTWALANFTQKWRFSMEKSRGYATLKWIIWFPFQPIFYLYRDIQGTRMLGNLANLMQSGMILTDALKNLKQGAQPWMRQHLSMIEQHLQIKEGDHVGAFGHGILPVFILSRMSSMVRRDAGKEFNKILVDLGTQGMADAREAVKQTAAKINGILLATAFGVIAFFYVGQNLIAVAIQDANSPSAVMRRQVQAQQASQIAPGTPVPTSSQSQPQSR